MTHKDPAAESAYQRWRERSLEQIGVYNNVLIGLASGAIILGTPLLLEHWDDFSRRAIGALVVATVLNIAALGLGIFVMSNRAEAFRIAARRARARSRGETPNKDFSEEKRDKVDAATLRGLRWQGAVFLLGLAVTAGAIALKYVGWA